jgi:hypothetical protein
LVPLASSAYGVRPFEQLVADGGYDSEANHRYCREQLMVESLIPAHNRRGTKAPRALLGAAEMLTSHRCSWDISLPDPNSFLGSLFAGRVIRSKRVRPPEILTALCTLR